MPITIHFTVSGRVQGVGFRYHTRNMADALGLSGWVRNMVDGNVEGVAQGDEENLGKFTDWLWRGPTHAKVTSVEFSIIEREQIPDFQITR